MKCCGGRRKDIREGGKEERVKGVEKGNGKKDRGWGGDEGMRESHLHTLKGVGMGMGMGWKQEKKGRRKTTKRRKGEWGNGGRRRRRQFTYMQGSGRGGGVKTEGKKGGERERDEK